MRMRRLIHIKKNNFAWKSWEIEKKVEQIVIITTQEKEESKWE